MEILEGDTIKQTRKKKKSITDKRESFFKSNSATGFPSELKKNEHFLLLHTRYNSLKEEQKQMDQRIKKLMTMHKT